MSGTHYPSAVRLDLAHPGVMAQLEARGEMRESRPKVPPPQGMMVTAGLVVQAAMAVRAQMVVMVVTEV
ncbi:hypothetical protein LU631_08335 [Erwinia tracheiphila]|nr:hypothetical protein LU604_18595 [Erwinia tracheiphila]UIA89236.1 hypothetical protein LU631_08335 [Erwinia tracheiphila]UIA91102.1 hypothetical protein LU632_18130 [Erwinia tracheiphila]UIA97619.1 hypothetical protein LU633_07020 [Erwinia tracheiphila]